jgi:EpsI family protein
LLVAIVLGAEHVGGRRTAFADRIDLDFADMLSQLPRVFKIRPTPQLVAAALMTAALSAAFVTNRVQPADQMDRSPFRIFPPEIAGWSGSVKEIPVDTIETLEADDYILIDFHHPDESAPVGFWSAYYRTTGADRGQIHSPEACLPGSGWNILTSHPLELPMALRGEERMTVNRATISQGADNVLVYYWFEGRGRTIANERVSKLVSKFDGLVKGRTDGALVRLTTPILPGENESAADARILRLMEPLLGSLPRFIPD